MITDRKLRFAFGNRASPRGDFDLSEWERQRPRWRQTHGTSVIEVKGQAQDCGEVDALFTQSRFCPIGVVTADCVPILMYREDLTAIGAIHAGWRGTESCIIQSFMRSLPEVLSEASAWRAIIGPSIRACCYQVSPELIDQFASTFPALDRPLIEPVERHLDLVAVNRAELDRLGVKVDSIHPDCTHCARNESGPLYYSYRRGDRDSRQFSIITLE